MATRIETIGGGGRSFRALWITLFAVVMIAAAIAIGTLMRSDGGTETVGPADRGAPIALEPATHVPGLIKAGLQPRPFAPIPEVGGVAEEVPEGFVRMPGGELRPTFGS